MQERKNIRKYGICTFCKHEIGREYAKTDMKIQFNEFVENYLLIEELSKS